MAPVMIRGIFTNGKVDKMRNEKLEKDMKEGKSVPFEVWFKSTQPVYTDVGRLYQLQMRSKPPKFRKGQQKTRCVIANCRPYLVEAFLSQNKDRMDKKTIHISECFCADGKDWLDIDEREARKQNKFNKFKDSTHSSQIGWMLSEREKEVQKSFVQEWSRKMAKMCYDRKQNQCCVYELGMGLGPNNNGRLTPLEAREQSHFQIGEVNELVLPVLRELEEEDEEEEMEAEKSPNYFPLTFTKAILDDNAKIEVEKYRRHLRREEHEEFVRQQMERGENDEEENEANGEDSDSDGEEEHGIKKKTYTFKVRPKSQTWFLPLNRRNTVRHTFNLKGMRFCSKSEQDENAPLREQNFLMPIKKHERGLMYQYCTGERVNFWGDGHYKFMLDEKQLTKLTKLQIKLKNTVDQMERSQNCQDLQNLMNKVVAIKQTIFCTAMNYEDPATDKLTELIRNINAEHSYASALYDNFGIDDGLVEQVSQLHI